MFRFYIRPRICHINKRYVIQCRVMLSLELFLRGAVIISQRIRTIHTVCSLTVDDEPNKKFELTLTRRAKAYNSY